MKYIILFLLFFTINSCSMSKIEESKAYTENLKWY